MDKLIYFSKLFYKINSIAYLICISIAMLFIKFRITSTFKHYLNILKQNYIEIINKKHKKLNKLEYIEIIYSIVMILFIISVLCLIFYIIFFSIIYQFFPLYFDSFKIHKLQLIQFMEKYFLLSYIFIFLYSIYQLRAINKLKSAIGKIFKYLYIFIMIFQIILFSTSYLIIFKSRGDKYLVYMYSILFIALNIMLIFYFFNKAIKLVKHKKVISIVGFILIPIIELYILLLYGIINITNFSFIRETSIINALLRISYYGALNVFTFPIINYNDSLIPFIEYILWYFYNFIIMAIYIAYLLSFFKHQK